MNEGLRRFDIVLRIVTPFLPEASPLPQQVGCFVLFIQFSPTYPYL